MLAYNRGKGIKGEIAQREHDPFKIQNSRFKTGEKPSYQVRVPKIRVKSHFATQTCWRAPPGGQDRSPWREPWGKVPSPRLRRPSPARAGEGMGERVSLLTHGLRRGANAMETAESFEERSAPLPYGTVDEHKESAKRCRNIKVHPAISMKTKGRKKCSVAPQVASGFQSPCSSLGTDTDYGHGQALSVRRTTDHGNGLLSS